jgi:hypothetical protein
MRFLLAFALLMYGILNGIGGCTRVVGVSAVTGVTKAADSALDGISGSVQDLARARGDAQVADSLHTMRETSRQQSEGLFLVSKIAIASGICMLLNAGLNWLCAIGLLANASWARTGLVLTGLLGILAEFLSGVSFGFYSLVLGYLAVNVMALIMASTMSSENYA